MVPLMKKMNQEMTKMTRNEKIREDEFLANSYRIMFNIENFVITFKQAVCVEKIQNKKKYRLSHLPIILDINDAKRLHSTLKKAVERYEEKYGIIDQLKKSDSSEVD